MGVSHFSNFTLENTQAFLILAIKDRVSIATICHGVLECPNFSLVEIISCYYSLSIGLFVME